MATEAVIDHVSTKRFKNAGTRMLITLSLPIDGNEALYLKASKNIGNAIEADLTILQGDLFSTGAAQEDADEGDTDVFPADMGEEPTGNPTADAMLAEAAEDQAQAVSNLASESSRNGRGRRVGAQLRDVEE